MVEDRYMEAAQFLMMLGRLEEAACCTRYLEDGRPTWGWGGVCYWTGLLDLVSGLCLCVACSCWFLCKKLDGWGVGGTTPSDVRHVGKGSLWLKVPKRRQVPQGGGVAAGI
jgi:hypothetical protein